MSLLNSRAKDLPNSLTKYENFIKIKKFKKINNLSKKNTNFNIINFIIKIYKIFFYKISKIKLF